MLRSKRVVGFLALAATFTIGVLTIAVAEPPDSVAKERIEQALEGKLPPAETAGGMLGDVIGIIRREGSILDGSSLDPNLGHGKESPVAANSARAYAAEQLLRASRLLEKLDATDQQRGDLVNRMRAEAGKLLME